MKSLSWKVALALFLSVLFPATIQAQSIGIVAKPWFAQDTRDLLGFKNHTAWEVTVTCPAGMAHFYRQDISKLLEIAELNSKASEDLLDKAEKTDSRKLVSNGAKIAIKAGQIGLTAGGIISGNVPLTVIGVGLTLADGAANVLKSVAPNGAKYSGRLLPDNFVQIPCVEGRGGQFTVITGKVENPENINIKESDGTSGTIQFIHPNPPVDPPTVNPWEGPMLPYGCTISPDGLSITCQDSGFVTVLAAKLDADFLAGNIDRNKYLVYKAKLTWPDRVKRLE